MTAGRGITHSERFEQARAHGGPMHGIQSWVALPEEDEEGDPGFAHYGSEALPVLEEGGAWMRLVAGSAFGARAGVRTHSPLCYLHCVLREGARLRLPDEYPERAIYLVEGEVEIEGARHEPGRMLVFRPGPAEVMAHTPALLMLLGGEPLGPRFIEWNFVSSRKERIDQAKADWRAGRMKLPDLDHDEFIPLPPDPPPPPNPMS
jgi:redox-sensitive bicupin YhaK (pirin superfamily)